VLWLAVQGSVSEFAITSLAVLFLIYTLELLSAINTKGDEAMVNKMEMVMQIIVEFLCTVSLTLAEEALLAKAL